LEVIGLLKEEEDGQIFQNGQRLFVGVEAEKKLLVVIPNLILHNVLVTWDH
jgi:hypothetical protein